MSKNDITGDVIRTKGVLTEEGRKNFDRIFGKKPRSLEEALEVIESLTEPQEKVFNKGKTNDNSDH